MPDVSNVFDVCMDRIHADPAREFLRVPLGGSWWSISYVEFLNHVDACRGGLAGLGVESDDAVAIAAPNRLEWLVACYAVLGRGAVLVPLDPSRPEDWAALLADCGARVALGGGAASIEALYAAQRSLPPLEVVVLDEPATSAWSYARLIEAGRRRPVAPAALTPRHRATILHRRAGRVDIDHGQLLDAAGAVRTALGLDRDDVVLMSAPWGRDFGQIVAHAALGAGASIAIDAGDASSAAGSDVLPTVMLSTAPALERIANRVEDGIAACPWGVRAILRRGLAATARERRGERISWLEARAAGLARRMLATRSQPPGHRLRCAVSGEPAGLDRSAKARLEAIGIPVRELAEVCPLR